MGVRILVVDDHEVVRSGIRAIISSDTAGQVVGEAASGEEAIEKVRELRPDLVILDVSLPGMDGLATAQEIRKIAPTTKILILTMHGSGQFTAAARAVGADAVVEKADASSKLNDAIKRLLH